MKQNLFTQLGDILRNAGSGSGLHLDITADGDDRLDVSVEMKDAEGKVTVTRFHVSGHPSVLDSNFGEAIVEPIRERSAGEQEQLRNYARTVETLQEEREAEKKKASAPAGPVGTASEDAAQPQPTFADLWKKAIASKNGGDLFAALNFFRAALPLASETQKPRVEEWIGYCLKTLGVKE